MSLDVVVVDYKTPNDLDQFLDSMGCYAPEALGFLTVVLVDPTSADRAVAAKWEPILGLQIRVFDTNVGYARACNRGALDGDGEVVAFFNSDIILSEGALDACYHKLLERPEFAILGPRQVDEGGRITAGGVFGEPRIPRQRSWQELDVGQCSDTRADALTVSGAAYFVKRTVWDELTACPIFKEISGGAEGAFLLTNHYYEETFMSYHARSHGHLCVFYGEICIIHKWHKASPHGGWADQQMGQSREVYRAACQRHNIPCE